jgi:hypothetical protein
MVITKVTRTALKDGSRVSWQCTKGQIGGDARRGW